MHAIERRQYDMLVRVRDFGVTYGHLFPPSSIARENFAAVGAAIEELDAQELAHMQASVTARARRKEDARERLLERLQAISQTARVLAKDAPGLDHQFEVPDPATDQAVLTAGRKFARDVEPLSSRFLAQGMPATFVADLNALVERFEGALRERGLGREGRRAARENTKRAIAAGIAAVRSLDAIVINHLAGDAAARALWDTERRIVYPKRNDPTAQPAPVPTAPAAPTGTKAA